MDCKKAVRVWIVWPLLLISLDRRDVRSEHAHMPQYCQNTVFNATCAADEVVVMTSALYGRMRKGKCVSLDMGYMGCKTDVLDIADKECSGRRTCEIGVPNGDMADRVINDPSNPCLKEVKSYLEAAYTCVKALVINKDQCKNPMTVEVSPYSGVISSFVLTQSGCGSGTTPWILEAMPGQVLNISLVDFHWRKKMRGGTVPNSHTKYGSLIDLSTEEMVTIKSGEARTKHLYLSSGHRVQLLLQPSKMASKSSFIISYQALGCPDLIAPKDGSLQRMGSELIIRCNGTRQTWKLQCNGVHWTGVIGNCTLSEAAMARHLQRNDSPLNMPHGLAIFIVAAVSILISCTIILIGVICIRRFGNGRSTYNTPATMHTYKPYLRPTDNNGPVKSGGRLPKNDYMHIWDHPLPEPFVEEYQHPSDTTQQRAGDPEISHMKLVQEEMSRGLERCIRTAEIPEDARVPPLKEDRVLISANKTDSGGCAQPESGHSFVGSGRECDNPDCVCFIGYEPSCGAHSLTQ